MIRRSSLDFSAPSSSRNHESVPPSAPGFLQEVTFPRDVPIGRASEDPLSGPVIEAKVNDVYRYANEGRKVILGPMPVTTFLDEFLPPVPFRERMPKCSGAFNKVPLRPKNEKQIYEALVSLTDFTPKMLLLMKYTECRYRQWQTVSKCELLRHS